jgi:hypothetical protein
VRSSASDVADSEPLSKVVAGAEWKRVDDVVLGTPVSRQAKYIDCTKVFFAKMFRNVHAPEPGIYPKHETQDVGSWILRSRNPRLKI